MIKKSNFVPIPQKVLFSIYSVLPLSTVLILVLVVFFDHGFLKDRNYDPEQYAFFTLLFTLPHILSSFFSFFDRDYVHVYGKKLLRGAQLTAVLAIILPAISLELSFFVFAVLTMIHVFRQQSGIAKSIARGANNYHAKWEWSGIVLSTVLYISIYLNNSLTAYWYVAFLGLTVPYCYFALRASAFSSHKNAKLFFWLTHSIPLLSGVYFYFGYTLLAIAVPRIIHDITAYCFYTTHDHNRYRDKQINYLYKVTSKFRMPVIFANIIVSVLLASSTRLFSESSTYFVLMFLFLYHYYTESFIWKKDTLHRSYIKIV